MEYIRCWGRVEADDAFPVETDGIVVSNGAEYRRKRSDKTTMATVNVFLFKDVRKSSFRKRNISSKVRILVRLLRVDV